MRVEFMAFADDCVIEAKLVLEADRLSDLIAQSGDFEIQDVVVIALDDGRTLTTAAVKTSRHDFAAIAAAGPRGNSARRLPTRLHEVRTRVGPYDILGYLHTPPSAHQFSGAIRRRVVPITSARLRYRVGFKDVEQMFDALLLNGDRISWLEQATNADLTMGDVHQTPASFRRSAKDMTGELSG
jgi:hypothetical protein